MDQVIGWFLEYGYWILVGGLFLEFLFLPFPGATVMTVAGILSHQGQLDYFVSILLAVTGASLGMLVSYMIGARVGYPFFERYGSKFFMGEKRRLSMQKWFNRFGTKVVFISFFIPGIRHFTGYFSGIVRLKPKMFLLYTVGGSLTWALAYVSLGYFFGQRWREILYFIQIFILPAGLIALLIFLLYYAVRRWFRR